MELAGLTALVAVAEKRSFTAAAVSLRVTPSAVSQTIRALEERVGVRLVQRTTRSVGLTEAGERFVARLRPALADVQGAFDALAELRDGPSGTLRLNLPRIAYGRLIEPHLPAFLAAYPGIRVDLVMQDTLADIVATGCDAGIRIGETVERDMIAVQIGKDEETAIVGSPEYLAARGVPRRPRDLAGHDCIKYRRSSGEIYRWELTEKGRDIEVTVEGRLTANDGEVMVRLARAGLGLANVFVSFVEDDLATGRLVRVLAPYCPPFPGLFLYYPSRVQLAPKLQAFLAFMQARTMRRRARR